MDETAQENEESEDVNSDAADDSEQMTETIGDENQVSYNDLVDDDFDTALKIGALPLAILGVLLIVAVFVYIARKKSAWADEDLGPAEDNATKHSENDFPNTSERSALEETEPAKKL